MSKKIFTIDRIEKNLAVLLLREDEAVQIDVSLSKLPEDIEEGTIIELELDMKGKVVSSKSLVQETNQARNNAQELLNKIVGKNNN